MFLNNNKPDNNFSMYEAILEANEAYYDICMKMVKCEHTAIINENVYMLSEAEESFKEKAKAIGKKLLAKFMSFIDRIKAEWSKLVATVASKFVNTENVEKMLKNLKEGPIEAKVNRKAIVNAKKVFEEVVKLKTSDLAGDTTRIETQLKDLDGEKVTQLSVEDIRVAVTFLKERKNWISQLEKLKGEAKKAYTESLGDDAKADGLLISKYSSIVSKAISRINFVTLQAVRACKAALSKAKKDKKETGSVGESYSILDLF